MATTALTLYDLEDRYLALVNSEDTASPEQEQEFRAELGEALRTAVQKRDRVAAFIRTCKHHEDAIDSEIDRLKRLKTSYVNGRERMQQYVVSIIESMGTDAKGKYPTLKGETCVLGVRRNPGHVEINDQSAVPDEFKTVTVTMSAEMWRSLTEEAQSVGPLPDSIKVKYSVEKTAVKDAIESGHEVPGADLAFGGLSLTLR